MSWAGRKRRDEGEETDLRGIDPVGISSEFSCIRTFCQSENLDCSMLRDQKDLFAQVGFWHMMGCSTRTNEGRDQLSSSFPSALLRSRPTHLSVLELLLHIVDRRPTRLAYEASKHQLWSNFTRPGDGSTDGHEGSDFGCSKLSDSRDERETVEGEGELSSEKTGRGGSGGGRGEVEVGGFELFDEVGEGSAEVREESGGREGGKARGNDELPRERRDEEVLSKKGLLTDSIVRK